MNTPIVSELSKHHLKTTAARVALLKTIEKENRPVDANLLIEKLRELNVDRVTVFRILNLLTEHGILRKLEFGEGKARYEKADSDHHHVVCERCGAIEDVSDCNLAPLEAEIAKKKGFKITRHSLEFFGLCSICQKQNN